MPQVMTELNIAEKAIAEIMLAHLTEMIKVPDDWGAEVFSEKLKLLNSKDGVKKFTIDFLTLQDDYPHTGDGDLPFTSKVMRDAWRSIDWTKVEPLLLAKVDKFRKVAESEIAKGAN